MARSRTINEKPANEMRPAVPKINNSPNAGANNTLLVRSALPSSTLVKPRPGMMETARISHDIKSLQRGSVFKLG